MLNQLLNHSISRALIIMNFRGISLIAKFALSLFIAHFMSFEVLGLYGLISGMSLVCPVVLGLSIMYNLSRTAITQDLPDITKSLKHYGRYLAMIYSVLLVCALIAGLYMGNAAILILIVLLLYLEHMGNDIYQLLLNLSRPFSANFLFFIRTALWIIVYIVAAYLVPSFRTLESLLISWIIGDIVALVGFFIVSRNWPWFAKGIETSVIRWVSDNLKSSKKLYINGIAHTSSEYTDRFLVTLFLGLELTGVYVLFWSVCGALSNLTRTGVVQLARPQLVKAYKFQTGEYNSIIKKCMKSTILVTAIMAFSTLIGLAFILPYINKPLILEWYSLFWIMLSAFMFGMMGEVMGQVFYSQFKDDITFKVSFTALGTSLVSNLLLLPLIGLWGAAISFLLTNLIAFFVQETYARRIMKPMI